MELSESPSLRAKAFAMPHVLGLTAYLLSVRNGFFFSGNGRNRAYSPPFENGFQLSIVALFVY